MNQQLKSLIQPAARQLKRLIAILPLLAVCQALAQTTETHSFLAVNQLIPDGSASGLSDHRAVTSALASVARLRVKLHVSGEFNGDLYAYLRHVTASETNFCVLLNRPGRSAATPWGYADAGLNVTFDDFAVNGNIHTYQAVTVPASGAPLTGSWQPDGREADPSAVLDTTPTTTALADFGGADPNGDWTLFVADVDSGATNMLAGWELELTGGMIPNVTWGAPADIVYGTALSSTQLHASSSVPGSYSYNPPAGTVLDAGLAQTLHVVFTPTDSVAYAPVAKTVSINVSPAPITVVANPQSKVYGAADPALTYSVSGLQGGDTAGSVLTGALARASGETVAGSPYAITQGTLVANSNYAVNYTGSSLTITPASTTGSVSSSVNPTAPGQSVTFRLLVNAVAPGSGTPTGTVQFIIDGSNAGSPVSLAGGLASLSLTTLAAGTHTVAAAYAGDGNFIGTTNTLAQTQLINTAPVGTADAIVRYPTDSTKVLISTLLANDSDADGNPIQFLAFTATTTNGGTVTRDGDWLHYTPAAGYTNDDAFTYTIEDSHQAQSTATVTVRATIDAVPAPNLVLSDLGNGSYLLKFDGIPGKTYRIQYAESLPNWETLGSSTADDVGMFEFTDTPPSGTPARFYRSVYP